MVLLPTQYKRGQTFVLEVNLTDSAGQPILDGVSKLKSQIRDQSYNLMNDLTIEATETAGKYKLSAVNTSGWLPGSKLLMDIRYNDGTMIMFTDTMEFVVAREITSA